MNGDAELIEKRILNRLVFTEALVLNNEIDLSKKQIEQDQYD